MYLAKLCRGQRCADLQFPLLDFFEDLGHCVCIPHPCWDDNGLKHTCAETPDFPFLHFYHSHTGEIHCGCSSIAHVDSILIARDLCPGQKCETREHPVLDWEEDTESCVCRSHPCWSLKGKRHSCMRPEFPILRYREIETADGGVESICECGAEMEIEEDIDADLDLTPSGGIINDLAQAAFSEDLSDEL
ncbi:unnamed protein product [Prorocentrum cordatum]|uniref:Uncharacterized protein n=1 Tax=Prorocentrum cordatum TaxID=2364126 RepID=A0ABN9WD84_9DINO|nr:unnamed protein product [Polarella glacialis]